MSDIVDVEREKHESERLQFLMNLEKRGAFETIMNAVNNPTISQKCFFLSGAGGCGKTFVCKALTSTILGNGGIVKTVAPTGLAATLLKGSKTVHSGCGISIHLNERTVSKAYIFSFTMKNLLVGSRLLLEENFVSKLQLYFMEIASSGGYDELDLSYYSKILQKTSITLFSIVFALGIIGNGLVIWIAGFRMKNTISAVWFLHLAIADFLCCSSLPLRIADWAPFFSHWPHPAYCIVNMFLFNVNMSASVLLLTAMSIDRWVSVMWPFWAKVHRSRSLVRISAAIIWGLSVTVAGAVYYVYRYHVGDLQEWCRYSFNYIYDYNPELYQTMQWIRLVIMCVIPFLIIVTSYVTIFYKLRKSKRSQRSQRSSRIITAVISCFFICWFPYYIWPIILVYYGDYITSNYWYHIKVFTFHTVRAIITSLACLNSCLNPIIYVFLTADFQHGFLRSIPSRLERALGDHPNDLCGERGDAGDTRPSDV
ncbi:formyl peptide receptor 2-like [Dendrobates tinctorius]|uniref:formyl peptide receptor 2-like n=1 Tax=Dendrobates tinctorius TaxID=92724 RepID=UPI003CC9C0F1